MNINNYPNEKKVLFSIVTVTYNNIDGLTKTISSVKKQNYENIEHIIIDGNSNDGTVEYLKNTELKGFWISEPDNGIYDAMNKGTEKSKGDFLIMLNAGDYLSNDDVLTNVAEFISMQSEKDAVFFGRAYVISKESSYVFPSKKIKSNQINSWLKKNVPNHQSIFFPRSFYLNEKFNLAIQIAADHDYKLRALKMLPFCFFDETIVYFELGGVSSSFNDKKVLKQILKESWRNNLKYYGFFYALKRVIINFLKYLISNIFGTKRLYSFLSGMRNR